MPIPTPNTPSTHNQYAVLATNEDDNQTYDNNATIQCSNKSNEPTRQNGETLPFVYITIKAIHPTAIVTPTRHKALRALCDQNNTQFKKVATKRLVTQVQYAILNSGATGHFLVEGAPIVNKRIAIKPITITLLSGSTIQSTHTCNINITWLPYRVTEAHIVPGLSHASLISTRKMLRVLQGQTSTRWWTVPEYGSVAPPNQSYATHIT